MQTEVVSEPAIAGEEDLRAYDVDAPYEARADISWSLVVDQRDGEIVATFRHSTYAFPGLKPEGVAQVAHSRAQDDARARNEAMRRERELLDRFELREIADPVSTCRNVSLDRHRRMVDVDGQPLELTVKEYEMLAALFREPERIYTRKELLAKVWDYEDPGTTRTLDTHARRLREKLPTGFVYCSRGVGYSLIKPLAPAER